MLFARTNTSETYRDALYRNNAVIEFDMNGYILEANDNFLKMMGYSLQEIHGKHHSIFVAESYAESDNYSQFWQALKQGHAQTAEFKRYARDGGEVWVQASYIPLHDNNGRPCKIVKIASDITAKKLKSIDNKGKIEAIEKSSAVIEFDLTGYILNANTNFLTTMGYHLDEIKGEHHSIFVDSEYARSEEYKDFWARLRNGEFTTAEFQRYARDGSEVWIQATYNPVADDEGVLQKVVKIANDITEQKKLYADYEGQIAAICRSNAVIAFDMNGYILDANDNFLEALGYSLEEIKGQHHSIFVDAEYARSQEYREFWDALRRGEFFSSEYRRYAKDGSEIWIMASYNPIVDLNDTPYKVVKFATDITSQMQARHKVSDLSSNVKSLASASEQMHNAVNEITQNMNESINQVDDIVTKTGHSEELTNDLKTRAQSMEQVITIIRDIADQTNLLALNATIEAARAGDAGKGFAVVANEVKNLASQTNEATDKIMQEIHSIQDTVDKVNSSAEDMRKAIDTVSDNINSIASAIEEQSASVGNISQNVQHISSVVDEIDQFV